MGRTAIAILRVVIALALAGSLIVQAVLVPLLWQDLDAAPPAARIAVTAIAVAGVGTMQVFAVCVWRLLTRVRRGSIFQERSFRDVDVITGAVVAASALLLALAVLLAPGGTAPGVVGLICGASVVLAGMALLVVVLKALLRQAIAREDEARALRDELGGVI
ncbi:DUF2975 domain-containing protein [Microbacterium gilvum]|uniref:DUF2975 domain-containing protein n=1 Tax=Microbacterium gilvum TaxID=1336204 RepID=A0ABP8ZXJ4_9MICO